MVIEGYILGMKAKKMAAPHQVFNGIKKLVGTDAATDSILDAWRNSMLKKADILFIKSLGFNTIRVPFHYNQFWDTTRQVLTDEGFTRLDTLLAWCAEAKLYAIPDLHCAPGSQNPGWHSDNAGPVNFWTMKAQNWPIASRVWKHVAQHYKNNPWIGGYDLLNEPVLYSAGADTVILHWYKDARDSIRAVDTNHMIIAEGNNYGYDPFAATDPLRSPNGRWDDNMCLEIHSYYSPVPPSNISKVDSISQAMDIPVWLGEFGNNSNTWFGTEIKQMEQRGYGWALWCYKKVSAINPVININIPPSYNTLLNYWLYIDTATHTTIPKPTAAQCRQGFADLCNAVQYYPGIKYQNDVMDALFRPDFLTRSIPYTNVTVPDTIRAVNYDMGGNGTGCYGTPFWTISNAPFTIWNQGWNYRDDAVGIDLHNGALNVGWTQTNGWMKYTFNVALPGTYSFSASTASYGSGRFKITIDSTLYTSNTVSAPSTGDWHTWRYSSLGSTYLTPGTHTMKFFVVANQFNIRDFVVTGSHLGLPLQAQPAQAMNLYPNPAANVLFVESRAADAAVYDVNGRLLLSHNSIPGLKELSTQTLAPGIYVVKSGGQAQRFVKE